MHGVLEYEGEIYLANLSVEESYAMDKGDNFKGTSNRLYSFRDIKIEPLRHVGFIKNQLAQSVLNGSTISVADLFALVKEVDKDFLKIQTLSGALTEKMKL